MITAGEFKRTVTVLGENTEKGKQKFQAELEETHQLFKQFVAQNRPHLDVDKVATGEHWFGQQALALQLVDELATSDDIILEKMKDKSVIAVKYKVKKPLLQKIGKQAEECIEGIIHRNLTKKWTGFYSIRKKFTYLTTLYTTLQKKFHKKSFFNVFLFTS